MDPTHQSFYARRRHDLMQRLGPRAVAVIHGSRLARRNSDVEHKYRAPSDLLFLTGCGEPETLAVIAPGREQKFTMFVRPRDKEREIWNGRRLGVEGAVAQLGADKAFPIAEAADRLAELLDGADEVHYLVGDDGEADRLVMAAIAALKQGERRGRRAPQRIVDLRSTLHEQRLIKDEDALARLRRAVEITTEAHLAAMRATRPGAFEYEIEALLDYTFRRRGGAGPGYGTIVGGGDNATILHYVENEMVLRDGDLLLIDAGGEFGGFTADVTRAFPVGKRFTEAQKRIYQVVLDTEKSCIDMVRPGADIEAIHANAVKRLTVGMIELGLLKGDVAQLIKDETYKRFYMHRTSHWLGLDVHDVGVYQPGGVPRRFEPGMVLTVEPGLYVPADAMDVDPGYRGVGIRIEDDVLVTATGHEVLTRDIPKEIDELEALKAAALA